MARSQVDLEILTHLGAAITELSRVQQSMAGIGNETEKSGNKLDALKGKLETMAPAARKVFAGATAAIGGATAAFASYETQLKNVQNISGQTDAEMAKMTQRFMDLPPTLGEADDLMKGLYQTISSGVTDSEDAFGVVVASAKAAKGNLADMSQTVDGLTSVLNAYNLEAGEATSVLDSMTKAVDLGKLTFGELSENIGKGISIASAAGVSYDELLSTLATLTLNGLSVEEAMTAIRNIMIVAIKPTKEVKDNMESLGVDMSATALKTEGFAAWMGKAAEAVSGNAEMTAQLFPNIRALNGAMKLASDEGLAKYNDTLEQITDSSGKVASNFENMEDRTAATFEAMVAELKKAGIAFGEISSEYVVPFIEKLTDLLHAFRELDEAEKQTVVQTTLVAGAISGVILAGPKLIAGFTTIKGAFIATGDAAAGAAGKIKMFNVAMGVAVVAGLALQYGINKLAEHINEAADRIEEDSRRITRQSEAMQDAVKSEGETMAGLARQLGVTATEEKNLSIAIRDRLLVLRAQGKLTEEQEKVLKSYAKALRDDVQATDDANAAGRKSVEVQQKIADIKGGLIEIQQELSEKEEERAKAQEKAATAALFSAEGMQAYYESVGDVVGALGDMPEPLSDSEKGLSDQEIQAKKTAGEIDLLTGAVRELNEEAGKEIKPPPPWSTDWQNSLDQISSNLRESLAIAIGDSLFEGFDSVGSWLGGVVEDWAGTFLEVWKEQVFRGEEFIGSFASGGTTPLQALQGFMGEAGENPWLYGMGGAASIYGGAQTGGVGGFLQGAMGGMGALGAIWPLLMSAGIASGPPGWIAMGLAALIGGGLTLFGGGEETPWFSAQYGDPLGLTGATGFDVTGSGGNMGFDERSREVFEQQMNELISETEGAWRDALLLFEMPELFDLIGDLPAEFFGELEMSTQEFAQYFGEVWLPDQMTNIYRPAIDTALSGTFNVTQDTLERLWSELGDLPGPERIQGLVDYITAVKTSAELLEDLQWDSILDAVGQSPRDAFVEMMTGGLADIDLQMLGLDQMSLIEQAQSAAEIMTLMEAARQAEIRYLQQIDQISKSIAASIGSQIEKLRLGGMSEIGQAEYAAGKIADIFGQLMAGDLSPDTVQMLVGDVQRYIDMLAGIMGEEGLAGALPDILGDYFGGQAWLENFDELFPSGLPADLTGRDFLVMLLEMLGTVSEDALDEARDEAAALNQEYIDRLNAINTQLTGFDAGLEGLAAEGGAVDMTTQSMEYLAETSIVVADEFERITAALSGWDPNALEAALQNHTVINIDPDLAPLITLIQEVVQGTVGGPGAPPPEGIF